MENVPLYFILFEIFFEDRDRVIVRFQKIDFLYVFVFLRVADATDAGGGKAIEYVQLTSKRPYR